MYRGTPNDTTTFGVSAIFVSSSNVSEDVIYNFVKAGFENFDDFKKLHPPLPYWRICFTIYWNNL